MVCMHTYIFSDSSYLAVNLVSLHRCVDITLAKDVATIEAELAKEM